MIKLTSVYEQVFKEITCDSELLSLLDISPYDGETYPPSTPEDIAKFDEFMTICRKQIYDGKNPDSMMVDFSTKLFIREEPTYNSGHSVDETGSLVIESFVSKEKNAINRKSLLIANRVIELFDTELRKRQGLKPLNIGLTGLHYYNRDPYGTTDSEGWDVYGVIFKYYCLI